MDVDKKRRNRPIEKRQPPEPTDSSFSLTTIPLYLLSKCFDIVKPLAPHFIPLLVFSVLVPLVFLISAGAGYAVWINAATGWEAPLYLQYGDGTSPYASVSLPALVTQQPYDISLHLNVPATQGNLELGNFMTSLRLASNSNQTLAAIRRPAIVMPYRSSLFASRQVVIDIPMLSSYAPTTSNLHATVSLGRQDNWKTIGAGEGRELAVYEASLRGVVVHKGIQGLVTRFPLLASTAASTIFLVVLFSLVALCVLPVMLPPRTLLQSEIDGDTSSDPAEHEVKKEEESARRRRRVARGNRSTSNRRPFKQESEEETVLPEAETSSPLRRRRSRMSESES